MHTKSDKPQTKLTILQQAVQVIMGMELELRGTVIFYNFTSLAAFFE